MEPYVGGAKYGGQVSPSYYPAYPKHTQVSPVYTKSHDACHYPVGGYQRSNAFVLVLFILLVIILRAWY